MSEPRFKLYELRHGEPHCIAEATTPQNLGVALVTIADENRQAGEPCNIIGVLDAHSRRWMTSLWPGREYTPFH